MALIGCFMRSVITLLALMVIGLAAWIERDRIREIWHDVRGTTPAATAPPVSIVTPEIAESAQRKLTALSEGDASRVALSEAELQSLMEYRYQQLLPGFIDSARVELAGDRLRLRVRIPAERLPVYDELGEAAELLPDTTDVSVRGQLLPLDDDRVAYAIDDVRAGPVPLPRRIVPGALERLGRRDEPGLPRDAVALPLPPGVAGAYVRSDSLVLIARPNATRN